MSLKDLKRLWILLSRLADTYNPHSESENWRQIIEARHLVECELNVLPGGEKEVARLHNEY